MNNKCNNEMNGWLLDISADDDVRKLIELIQDQFDIMKERGISKKDIAALACMDPSFLSRVVNGRVTNPNVKTIAKIFRAMGSRLEFNSVDLNSIPKCKSNYTRSADYDSAKFEMRLARAREEWNISAEQNAPVRRHPGKAEAAKPAYSGSEKFFTHA